MKNLLAIIFFCMSGLITHSQNKLDFEFDYARYKLNDTIANLELYYSIGQSSLTKVESDGQTRVKANLSVLITEQQTQKILLNKKYSVNNVIHQTSKKPENLVGVLAYNLPVGEYSLEIKAEDGADTASFKLIKEEIGVYPYSSENITISDIELASRIITESNNPNSIFYKNTMEVIPNPVSVFGLNLPMVFYYTELYNLSVDSTKGDLLLNTQVLNSYGKKVYEKSKQLSRSNNSIVEVGAINTSNFSSGSYNLLVNLVQTSNSTGVSSQKQFFIINPNVEDTVLSSVMGSDVLTSQFGVLSEEECDELFGSARYIAFPKEIDQYESLDSLDAKREFFYNFFKARDTNPETVENEFKREFDQRIALVNSRYRTFTKKGYKTDRGRVFLTYGEPDEIELYPNDYNRKPYEIWHFHSIEGGVQFVFGDLSGYSDYELLHSNKRGELRDDNWVRRITAN